jgi:signal transduction histidine kinase
MFRSIRWRLVASYVFLTLLTVGLMGVLALSLIKQYVERQEQDYLAANAEAVARQALPLMRPLVRQTDLEELAHTASFLGNVQVRILDRHRQVLADSGDPAGVEELMWIAMPMRVEIQPSNVYPGAIVVFYTSPRLGLQDLHQEEPSFIFEGLPPGTEFTAVRRAESPWGTRFYFGARQRLEMMDFPPAETLVMEEALESRATPRSERVTTVHIGEVNRPLGYVELSKGPDFAAEALATASRAFLFAAGGATLLAIVLGLLVGRGLTAPLRGLTAAAGQMTGGDLSIRAAVRGKDEIGQLAEQFNHMAERLEASFAELATERDSLRRFIADASHELRTPVTALKNFNELLQGAAADDSAARAEFLAESQRQLERLEWITHNLLDLSRLEAGLVTLDIAGHDAGEMIQTAAAAFKPPAGEKGITLLIVEPSPPFKIHCDRARIELALSNLLDNGLKFTPPGGRVEIGAEQAGQTARLWVQDSGPGIPADEQERVFERFYRGPDNGADGSGLGLAIVRAIVEAHEGHVTVESEPGTGSRFVIELPLDVPGSGQ